MNLALALLLQGCGVAVMAIVLADVFLTVLYARVGVSVYSNQAGRLTWRAWRWAAMRAPRRRRGVILSFCGPVLMIALIFTWAVGLAIGAALVFYPKMGTAIQVGGGEKTPTDFITALFVATNSLSVLSSGNYAPKTAVFKLIFMFNSLVGACMISLTLTYLMQVYNALQRRSTAALNAYISANETGDGAELVTGLGPAGDFREAPTRMAVMASELAAVKESHHFYSLLLYFRFPEPESSPSRLVTILLDATSLIRSALDQEHYATFVRSGAVTELSQAATRLLAGLDDALLRDGAPDEMRDVAPEQLAAWRRRFDAAIRLFREAGIATAPDEDAGFKNYAVMRAKWQPRIDGYRDFAGFEAEDVDPIGAACAAEGPPPAGPPIDLTAAA